MIFLTVLGMSTPASDLMELPFSDTSYSLGMFRRLTLVKGLLFRLHFINSGKFDKLIWVSLLDCRTRCYKDGGSLMLSTLSKQLLSNTSPLSKGMPSISSEDSLLTERLIFLRQG
jgi:hypothetical protein